MQKTIRKFLQMAVLIIIFSVFAVSSALAASDATTELMDISLWATGGIQLSPPFSSNYKKYNAYVNNDVTNVVIKVTAKSPQTKIKINANVIEPNTGNGYMAKLNVGINKFRFIVTGKDGSTEKYILHITRENIQPVVDKFLKLTYTDMETGTTMQYRLFKPEYYNPENSYPMVLFLHGSGECGSDNEAQLLATQGATVWAKPEEQARHPCFVLAPQAQDTWLDDVDNKKGTSDIDMALKVLDRVMESYNIDKNRLYATGVSDGATGVWNLNQKEPALFAAMVPVCGIGDPEQAYKLIDKPIWVFHGEGDPVISVNYARDMIQSLRNLGANPLFTEYPRETYIYPIAHYSWISAYQTREMRDWVFSQVKKQ